jgi:type II restriction/modification system DNA methylase subunit YeeA
VKVLDLACGSGAFLVYVFEFLMKENQRVGDILGGGLYSSDDCVRNILSDKIFGVDVNRESVEITKLSLWLKTAERGKKLTALYDNIKNGNSLSPCQAPPRLALEWAGVQVVCVRIGARSRSLTVLRSDHD